MRAASRVDVMYGCVCVVRCFDRSKRKAIFELRCIRRVGRQSRESISSLMRHTSEVDYVKIDLG